MDIRMPGIDGGEAARRIRSGTGASRSARLAFLTAHIRTDDKCLLRLVGAEAVLAKPLRLSVLRDLLAGRKAKDGALRPPSEAGPTHGTPVDSEVIRQLRDTLQEENFASVLARFIAEGDSFATRLPDLADASASEMARQVHALAGSAAICGATALQITLGRAEAALLNGDRQAAQTLLDEIPELWRKTRAELEDSRDAA
jgi:CheY-like chemotaxis protein